MNKSAKIAFALLGLLCTLILIPGIYWNYAGNCWTVSQVFLVGIVALFSFCFFAPVLLGKKFEFFAIIPFALTLLLIFYIFCWIMVNQIFILTHQPLSAASLIASLPIIVFLLILIFRVLYWEILFRTIKRKHGGKIVRPSIISSHYKLDYFGAKIVFERPGKGHGVKMPANICLTFDKNLMEGLSFFQHGLDGLKKKYSNMEFEIHGSTHSNIGMVQIDVNGKPGLELAEEMVTTAINIYHYLQAHYLKNNSVCSEKSNLLNRVHLFLLSIGSATSGTAQHCIDWADDQLAAGSDAPSLRILAGLPALETEEIIKYTRKSMDELNICLPDMKTAAISFSKELVTQMVRDPLQIRQNLRELEDLCICTDYLDEIYDFYLLSNAYGDLEIDGVTYHWRVEADRSNIQEIVLIECCRWLDNLKRSY